MNIHNLIGVVGNMNLDEARGQLLIMYAALHCAVRAQVGDNNEAIRDVGLVFLEEGAALLGKVESSIAN